MTNDGMSTDETTAKQPSLNTAGKLQAFIGTLWLVSPRLGTGH